VRAAEEYLRPDLIQEISRLDLKAKFIIQGFISGLHDSPYYGFSSEFSEHRKYTTGDRGRRVLREEGLAYTASGGEVATRRDEGGGCESGRMSLGS